jgi:AcrR family transcriptional regulator
MADPARPGRPNQRRRTRKDLLEAAARLMRKGRSPTLEEVAEEALVSRATAYRYFSTVEALLIEAALDIAVPSAEDLFAGEVSEDPVARLAKVDRAMAEMMRANEPALRMMLIHSLELALKGAEEDSPPSRQNRRQPLIEAALSPLRRELEASAVDRLAKALALLIGTEAMIVFKDVLRLGESEAAEIRAWAIRALVESALRRG